MRGVHGEFPGDRLNSRAPDSRTPSMIGRSNILPPELRDLLPRLVGRPAVVDHIAAFAPLFIQRQLDSLTGDQVGLAPTPGRGSLDANLSRHRNEDDHVAVPLPATV